MGRREQESPGPQEARELGEPAILHLLVEMGEDGDGENHVEGVRRQGGRWRRRYHREMPRQVARRPGDLAAIDVDAGVDDLRQPEPLRRRGRQEMARDAPAAAAEVEPARGGRSADPGPASRRPSSDRPRRARRRGEIRRASCSDRRGVAAPPAARRSPTPKRTARAGRRRNPAGGTGRRRPSGAGSRAAARGPAGGSARAAKWRPRRQFTDPGTARVNGAMIASKLSPVAGRRIW